MDTKRLSSFEKDQLLDFFAYYMPMEQRQQLMATLPQAYNAWCGSEVVEVRSVEYGLRCDAPRPEGKPSP